jgi:DNA-directed RNA polymerase II subunit RPB2
LTSEIFPHHGIAPDKKKTINILTMMMKKLILTATKQREEDSRDALFNKRLATSGILTTNLLTMVMRRMLSELNKYIKQKMNPSIESLITKCSVLVTVTMNRAMATGKWSANARSSTKYTATGVSNNGAFTNAFTQQCNMLNIVCPSNPQASNLQQRLIHPSTIGYISPFNTPEGKNAGLQLVLAIACIVSQRRDLLTIIDFVNHIVNNYCKSGESSDKYNIYVNGVFTNVVFDYKLFVKKFKLARTKKLIPFDVSVMFNDVDKEIHIWCDEGRPLRPLFVVKKSSLEARRSGVDSAKPLEARRSGVDSAKPLEISLREIEAGDTDLDTLLEKKIIEYVDANESSNCFIAETIEELDYKGVKFTHVKIHPSQDHDLLFLESLFPNCNPSARNVFGLAMHKSAVGAPDWHKGISQKSICSNIGHNPLVSTSFENKSFDNAPCIGINATVIIAALNTGKGIEDGFQLNKTSLKDLLNWQAIIRSVYSADTTRKTSETHNICKPKLNEQILKNDYSKLNEQGAIKKGSKVEANLTVLIGRTTETNGVIKDTSIISSVDGIVDNVEIFKMNGIVSVTVTIRESIPIEIGNKFSTNTAQKATACNLIDSQDMPYTDSGFNPDVVINPHSMPSRMTCATIYAAMLGMKAVKSGRYQVQDLFQDKDGNMYQIDMEESHYETFYCGMTGELIGRLPVYILRLFMLKHIAEKKKYARGPSGPTDALTRQPNGGRKMNGGLRFGEMESEAIMAHGAAQMLNNLSNRSDSYIVCVCKNCGILCTRAYKTCHMCKKSTQEVKIPWANVIVQHLLMTMGVRMSLYPPTVRKMITNN